MAVLICCCQLQQIALLQTSLGDDQPANPPALPRPWAWLESAYQSSHFVELEHCSLDSISVSNFTQWASSISRKFNATIWRDEWTLQLLEMQAVHTGLCNFSRYHTRLPPDLASDQQLRRTAEIPAPPGHARIAFTIIAYQDAIHLERLIDAIHMPHHYIIIHLEEATSLEFQEQVRQIARQYQNVIIRQFGTILYKTDSISRVQLQMMNWLVQDLQLDYDYHISLGGAVYPLWSSSQLAQELHGNVYMGELTHKGMRVHHPQWSVLWKKRVLSSGEKGSIRMGFLFDHNNSPEWMDQVLQHKATSGNQAVYARHVVKALLQNEQALHLLALAKYGCCCCVEERSWIAAMHILGFGDEAKKRRSMLQLWGGEVNRCSGSMSNAVLDLNADRCYRHEDPLYPSIYVWGNETWSQLLQAKENGILFARKFHSSQRGSVQLIERIRQELHV